MYNMPVNEVPSTNIGTPLKKRLEDLKKILVEELDEIDEIIEELDQDTELQTLTKLADLLGDVQVYCASEMTKFGLPVDATLEIIMDSNFSKLDANGNPIYDDRNKLLKGPNYWKPEPKIEQMLLDNQQEIDENYE